MTDQWPPNYYDEYLRRLNRGSRLRANPDLRAGLMVYYAHNPIDWINDFCVTFDPRKKDPDPKVMPFVLFKRQREFIQFLYECWKDNENGLVEKCRDAGVSWLCCAFSVWLYLFHQGSTVGWGSRKEEYVDKKGDPKAIFPKIRQILENLPFWMLPREFNMNLHGTYMKITNPQNGAAITGEAGDNIGRGGRTSIFFKDESAHYDRPELIEAALGDNTNVQIDVSSVNGSANVFYRRRMAGVVWEPGAVIPPGKTRVFIFDWRDHPDKTQEWYDMRRRRAEEEGLMHVFAQEVDRDYSGSLDGVIIPADWVKCAIDAHIVLGFPAEGEIIAAQDVADGGGDKNALVIRHGVVLIYGEHWGGEAGEAAERAVPICIEHGVREIYYDSIGVGAGFKTQINTMKQRPGWPPRLRVSPWNAGAAPLDPDDNIIPGDADSPLNKDQYANMKAQGWFRLRARFYKTMRAVRYGESYDPSELISFDSRIPKIHQIVLEMSQAVRKNNGDGKTVVDKKPDGATSPNLADAVNACYNPSREVSIFDSL